MTGHGKFYSGSEEVRSLQSPSVQCSAFSIALTLASLEARF